MINPTRRNRYIGTAKQGYSQDNKLVVPYPAVEMKSFFERLGEHKTIEKIINGHKFRFVVEKTRQNSFHACTIEDIEQILNQIPKEDYGELELIILRQPTRKEENLKSVWGRMIYSYEFENDYSPAVIIEAVDLDRTFKWPKKLSVDSQKELKRLKEDGHKIKMSKRFYEAEYELRNIRATQLYRTLPHEFGHYVHYLEVVKRPLSEIQTQLNQLDDQIDDNDTSETNPLFDKWNSLDDEYNKRIQELEEKYFSIPSSEKEVFAHSYADELKKDLTLRGIVPFMRIINEKEIIENGLNLSDFKE
ncbi:hypothetical protein BTO06_11865 [Tenacibaculum sp. SZ-18]|uniref:hypothetical protein n=1 Tax=Tenacibaculum sp. SZ-18 TaxID=754423 RepID=UPI000C2D1510|nr:hypothetical protein [Tenacibaculum sp. SZ-18]AUC15802.1 hypothetical protein BTO06_11865 [Tenacibaculum sp. SZ-18]